MKSIHAVLLSASFLTLAGCTSPSEVAKGDDKASMTVGVAQRSIKVGMSGAEVATAMGSPNIVSTDETGCEVWIYDRISSTVQSSNVGGYFTLIFVGASGGSSAAVSSQSSLTVIVKFDKQGKVRDLAYHSSKF
jgi:outer membrane protein assembly factor BamE (lipoprotein component of BamABCDE complex)